MEIKRPFSWTSSSRGPSEVEGVRRGPRVGGPRAAPQTPLPLLGDQATVPLLTTPSPCTGRGPAQGPVATAESPERTQGCGGRRAVPAGSERLLGPARSPSCCRR